MDQPSVARDTSIKVHVSVFIGRDVIPHVYFHNGLDQITSKHFCEWCHYEQEYTLLIHL